MMWWNDDNGTPPPPPPSWKAMLAWGIAAFGLAFLMIVASQGRAYGVATHGSSGFSVPDMEGEVITAMKDRIALANLPRPEPEPAPEPAPDPEPPAPASGNIPAVWAALAECESHGDWSYNEHSGWGSGIYDGGLQFHPDTWLAYGGGQYAPAADQATPHQQIAIAERVLADAGWIAWPSCSRKLGYR